MERSAAEKMLEPCYRVAEHTPMIWVCGGASNVGRIAYEVGVLLTLTGRGRMCCTSAIGAGSRAHVEIALKAGKNVVINGCGNRCASRILESAGVRIDREVDVSKYVRKMSTLEVLSDDVKKIAEKVVEEAEL